MSEPTGHDRPTDERWFTESYLLAEELDAGSQDWSARHVRWLADEVKRLRAAALAGTPLPYPDDRGSTHWEGCWRDRGHHNCAVAEVERLRALAGTAPADENLRLHVGEAREALRAIDGPPLPKDSANPYAALYYPLLFLADTVEATLLATDPPADELPPDTDYDRGFAAGVATVARIESARLLAEHAPRPWYAFSALGDPPVGAPAAPAPEATDAIQRADESLRHSGALLYREGREIGHTERAAVIAAMLREAGANPDAYERPAVWCEERAEKMEARAQTMPPDGPAREGLEHAADWVRGCADSIRFNAEKLGAAPGRAPAPEPDWLDVKIYAGELGALYECRKTISDVQARDGLEKLLLLERRVNALRVPGGAPPAAPAEPPPADEPYPHDLETALLILEEWAVERFPNEGRFVTGRKDAAWKVTQAFRGLRAAPPPSEAPRGTEKGNTDAG